jgi:hypothetical protein
VVRSATFSADSPVVHPRAASIVCTSPRQSAALTIVFAIGMACGVPKDAPLGANAAAADGADVSDEGTDEGVDGMADGAAVDGAGETGSGDGGPADGGDGSADPVLDDEAALSALESAAAGLWYTSESDYPLDVVLLADPGVSLTVDNATTILAPAYSYRDGTLTLEERAVDEVSLGVIFDRYTVPQDWWDDTMRADAARWQALRAIFELQLDTPHAFRLGGRDSLGTMVGDIDIFVLGRTSTGAWAGVRTVSIET